MGDLLKGFEEKKAEFDAWVKTQPPAVRDGAARAPTERSRRASGVEKIHTRVIPNPERRWRHNPALVSTAAD